MKGKMRIAEKPGIKTIRATKTVKGIQESVKKREIRWIRAVYETKNALHFG
jgi:hypothetical protein